jgi:hypothetical protein
MKKIILALLLLPTFAFGQFRDQCPSFKVTKQKSGMHYELKKYKMKRYPTKGIVAFGGYYYGVPELGGGATLRVQLAEYGISAGWDARSTNPNVFKKEGEPTTELAYTNVFGLTLGKYFLLGKNRGLIDFGGGFGHSAHGNEANMYPVFGYGLASYRFYRNFWLSGAVHVTDFESTPRYTIGIATLVW